MGDLEFKLYKVPSQFGDWLAVFEGKDLIYLGNYSLGKKKLEEDVGEFFHEHYHFHLGSFTPVKWNKGNFWTGKHDIKLQGTEFQVRVWLELLKIPMGKSWTYTEVAKKMRRPSAVRAIASAIAKNPVCYWIPCHRVVGKGASKLKYKWGPDTKEVLLRAEGALK
ncbi:6-O-methylguanine DNA methyltransferase [Bdellovibrio bacteriovorus]|uniref:6-O-methylguanine DNA methyltransferase n=1 Tax=Bdellovibrio bacteriovorus TaxID=959 RepID=A0A150WRF4_BDEBC|nr:methylated-DNA--[protein]-cysteine S-methyltransferase [Bdellovibrio bacteriovorus]KYG67042.1 6-O-methylguanine DNA methyltransferase [Bdellovibrio bacteriovorus]